MCLYQGVRAVCVHVHSHALCQRVAGELPFGLDGSRVPFTCVPLPFQSSLSWQAVCLYQGVRVCAFPCLVPEGCWGATIWVGWFPCAIYLCACAIPKLAELAGGVPVPRCACMCIPMPCARGLLGSYCLGWMVPVCHLLVCLCHSKVS